MEVWLCISMLYLLVVMVLSLRLFVGEVISSGYHVLLTWDKQKLPQSTSFF